MVPILIINLYVYARNAHGGETSTFQKKNQLQ